MTAILAINFLHEIVILADCRVSWQAPRGRANPRPQDNLQKLYPFGPTGVLGFAGDVYSAKRVFARIQREAARVSMPASARAIADEVSGWAQDEYARMQIPPGRQPLELMYVASDWKSVSLAARNAVFSEQVMVEMTSPEFRPSAHADAIRLGLARRTPMDNIKLNRDAWLGLSLDPDQEKFFAGVFLVTYSTGLAARSPAEVGGMFCAGITSVTGVRWYSYSIGALELRVEDGQFVQYDHNNGRRVPLKLLWEFDASKPDAGDNVFNPEGA